MDDFEWLCQSPSLVTSESVQCAIIEKLGEVVPPAEEFSEAVLKRNSDRLRLGIYFEDLVETFLRNAPGVTDFRRNVAVRDAIRTLGEFDILYRNRDGETEHWEIAVKFYLYAPGYDPDPDRCFLGPRTIDRLDRKLKRMREHQLLLSKLSAAIDVLGSGSAVHPKALVRGRLYYPLESEWQSVIVSSMASADHLRGWWTPRQFLSDLPVADRYLVVEKRDWMSCPSEAQGLVSYSRTNLADVLDEDLRAPVQVIGIDEEYRELHRGFVVPNEWPNASAANEV